MIVDACDSLAVAARCLSTRIVEGATLWAMAPGMDDHAHHVAVEFVHPSSVGATAVPAVAVTGQDDELLATMRRQVRAGDVIVSMGSDSADATFEVSRRSAAWGTDHVHLGWPDGESDRSLDPRTFVVRLDGDVAGEAALTRAYHLLWELTFICLHNQKLATHPSSTVDPVSCSVCADEATTTEVVEVLGNDRARVQSTCGPDVVDISLIDCVQTHDLLLVHAGVALRRLT